MDKITSFLTNPDNILPIALLLAVGTALVSALKFYFELTELLEDLGNFIHRKDFKVKRTILKVIAKDNQTQIIKLRTLRIFRRLKSLEIDWSPEIVDDNDQRFVQISDQYSIPGVVMQTHTYHLRVDFRDDEIPKARQDYTYVTSRVVNGTMQELWGIPGIVASKPAGSESLTVEFFCAPSWCYLRNARGKPEVKVYSLKVEGSKKEDNRVYLPSDRITCDGGSYPFEKQEGPIDWIRVIVKKPPRDADIYVDWFWDQATQNKYDALEAVNLAGAPSQGSSSKK